MFVAVVLVWLTPVNVCSPIFVQDDEPPPEPVPVVIVPSDARNILPLATSDAVAVVTEASSNRAVPPPVFFFFFSGTLGIAPV